MAFSVAQNFQTSSDHKEEGSTALGILYACFTASNFVSSFIVQKIGSKWSLFLGSLCYVGFVASNISYQIASLFTLSALLGFGASVIWTAQGAYISNCSALHERANGLPVGSTLGYFNGVFFSIFQGNMVIGSLITALLFQENVPVSTIFIIMTCIGSVGASTLTCLRNPAKAAPLRDLHHHASPPPLASPTPSGEQLTNFASPSSSESSFPDSYSEILLPVEQRHLSPFRRFLSVFDALKMLALPRMYMFIPLMIYSGLSQTFIFGTFPPLIEDRSTKFYVIATIGAFDVVSSMAMGKLSDRYGRVIVLALGLVTAGSVILFLMFWEAAQTNWIFFVVAAILGTSDGVFNTQIYAILGCWFEGVTEKAFANYKLFQAGSTAVAFLINSHVGLQVKCIYTGVALALGFIFITIFDLQYRARGGVGSVLDSAPPRTYDDELSSPMLISPDSSAYTSPRLDGHTSVNIKGAQPIDLENTYTNDI